MYEEKSWQEDGAALILMSLAVLCPEQIKKASRDNLLSFRVAEKYHFFPFQSACYLLSVWVLC